MPTVTQADPWSCSRQALSWHHGSGSTGVHPPAHTKITQRQKKFTDVSALCGRAPRNGNQWRRFPSIPTD
ncbi:unnamed protein product [Ceratitis capitata]|uniref:(Mediterranean fruit fly) hypothetical protein n=1 Tax=Ceratitis capitata TaxID=7213 RepID=A0A811V0S0_CERCA|nr:unnamed protein product [Ceratitis capitata]